MPFGRVWTRTRVCPVLFCAEGQHLSALRAEPAHPRRARQRSCRENTGSLSAFGIRVERAIAPVSSVMKGDGQVITKAAVINRQLRGFTQSLDTPEDTLSAADVATGASCNVRLSNQSLSNRRNELAVHVCVSNRRCNKKGNLAGYAMASPSLARLMFF